MEINSVCAKVAGAMRDGSDACTERTTYSFFSRYSFSIRSDRKNTDYKSEHRATLLILQRIRNRHSLLAQPETQPFIRIVFKRGTPPFNTKKAKHEMHFPTVMEAGAAISYDS